jgi:hypothetical protein
MYNTITVLAVFFASTVTFAQSAPKGTHRYIVEGVFEGQAMEPWEAAVTLRDTSMNGRPALFTRYQSRRTAASYRFDYSALWIIDSGAGRSEWIGNGRAGPQTCNVEFSRSQVNGQPVSAPAIPEFAIGPALAALPLQAGDTVRFTLFRCDTGGIRTFDFIASVTNVEQPASALRPKEKAFKVTGGSDYPAEVLIAHSDRQILRVLRPQGIVGISIESYAGSNP